MPHANVLPSRPKGPAIGWTQMAEGGEQAPFAALLRQLRAEAELTQEALAEKAELSPRSIQKLERGESLPYPVTVQRLARALALSPDQRAAFQSAATRVARRPTPPPAVRPSTDIAPATTRQPTGVVTLLFTDVEGSTTRWERDPETMRAALARHNALIQSAIESPGGYVFKIVGDAFCAAFQDAVGAVTAAVSAQRAFLREHGPDADPPKVRMAIHTGPAEAREGDYAAGPTLNRAARLLSAAHGEQILASSISVDMVEGQLPADLDFRFLGEHHLRDLARPERIYQVLADGLPESFPPLRTDQSLDSHFEVVAQGISAGRIVLFLGEHINTCGRALGASWHPGSFDVLPTRSELAAYLAKTFGYPAEDSADLVRVAQYVSVMAGPGLLHEALHSVLDVDYRPNILHEFVASLPSMLRERSEPVPYPLVVTTNYDDALERAYALADEPFDLVVYAAEGEGPGRFWHQPPDGRKQMIDRPNKYLGLALNERAVILKIHGAVDRVNGGEDSFVVTEDDYLDYLTKADLSNLVPVSLAARLRKSHYLFLGYSLRDWNLRVILHRLWGEQRLAYKSWAAQLSPDVLERELWRKRDVDIVRVRLEDYISELRERFLLMPQEVGVAFPEQV
jgi:class 3 adenylate cyclase